MKKLISAVLALSILFNLTACGTILYPERKGQRAGRIDPAIAVLDGVGLLVFLIPGVIAYAVDFNNGTIYLPSGGGRSSLENVFDKDDMVSFNIDKEELTRDNIDHVVAEKTGKVISGLKSEVFRVDANGKEIRVN